VVATLAVNVTEVPRKEGFAVTLKAVVVDPEAGNVDHVPSNLLISMEPKPVASSYPVPTRYPASPPVRLVGLAVLLLHMLGVVTTQPVTPLEARVTSWNAVGCVAANL
jgi:hypothetical protein